jgi:hypothetical protein
MTNVERLADLFTECRAATVVAHAVWCSDFSKAGRPRTSGKLELLQQKLALLSRLTRNTPRHSVATALVVGGINEMPPIKELEPCWRPRKNGVHSKDELEAEFAVFRRRYADLNGVIAAMRVV